MMVPVLPSVGTGAISGKFMVTACGAMSAAVLRRLPKSLINTKNEQILTLNFGSGH
jgi:hypothetical protein